MEWGPWPAFLDHGRRDTVAFAPYIAVAVIVSLFGRGSSLPGISGFVLRLAWGVTWSAAITPVGLAAGMEKEGKWLRRLYFN